MSKTLAFISVILLAVLTGCGGSSKEGKFSVHGYICNQCKAKFYTDGNTYALKCPSCGDANISFVSTYVCDADYEKTIALSGRAGANCSKCRKHIPAGRYPTEEELKEWGASYKTASEVGAN